MWSKERYPLEDETGEEKRQADYWRWLKDNVPKSTPAFTALENVNGTWVQLKTEADADFEAYHMQHSIGFSWGKYSSLGRIYSHRNITGIPCLTALVVDGCVIHARGRSNTVLDNKQLNELRIFARGLGLQVADYEKL